MLLMLLLCMCCLCEDTGEVERNPQPGSTHVYDSHRFVFGWCYGHWATVALSTTTGEIALK